MAKQELYERSPIRAFDEVANGGLKAGELGLVTSKKGLGKTSVLVQFGMDTLLNGTVCVSDRSEYLDINYHDGENIVYFDLNNPEQLAEDISWLLAHPKEASKIARKGYETALKYDTWDERFDIVLDMIGNLNI